jgi:hypothetical protein
MYESVLIFAVGCLFGAWVYGRGRSGLSVLPNMPKYFKGPDKMNPTPDEQGKIHLPEVKP